jgi:aminocarboxymuconate-semialdehyde decarboxylase
LIIDFHNHFYPKAYLVELNRAKGYASVSKDERGRLLIKYAGDYNIVVGPHTNLEDRVKAMQKHGIDMQVLTLTTPGVDRETPEKGTRLARLVNDSLGEAVAAQPDRFAALATLPLQDPTVAATELERAVQDCGLNGATLMSNANSEPLDSEKLMPIYQKTAKLNVPLFIHPTSPLNQTAMEDYRLVPILGFGVDTALAVLRLVFSGVMKRLPNLKLVASHLGGVFPYLRGRIDKGFNSYPECKTDISQPPSHYLKKVWMDSLCYDHDILTSTLAYSGAEKILLGTDYPHQISDLENAVQRIKRLNTSDEDKRKMLGENAAKLLKL